MIDPHVHCRDGEQSYKETIAHALSVAERAGLSGIFDMPNTDPPITTIDSVRKRLAKTKEADSPVFYGLYIGITPDPEQVRQAVDAWELNFPKAGDRVGIMGLKMYAGKSVGDLAVIDEDDQRQVYRTLAEEGFDGVLAVHCAKEAFMKPDLWNRSNPMSHCDARPPESEYKSAEDQINFSLEAGFKGHLHITHVSTHKTVCLVNEAKAKGRRISCGVTPHHLILNKEYMNIPKQGILYKVNPPLRSTSETELLLEDLRQGRIDWIETDHAPHTYAEKTGKDEKYMSGFPGLPFYPHFINYLRKHVGLSEQHIQDITHNNICRIYRIDIPLLKTKEPDLNLHTEYEVDVYKGVREKCQN